MKLDHSPPIVMLGVDAASIDFIRSNLSRLPTFQRLLNSGAYQYLQSWGDVVPGSVWPSFATGKPPGEHGIYHHIQWDPSFMTLKRITSEWLGFKPFWQDLIAAKKRVCVVDVPMTFPGSSGDTLEIMSWASHDQLVPFSCNRPDVERVLRRRFGKNPMGQEIPVLKSPRTLRTIRERLINCARKKGELIRWLLELEEWDLFIAVFGETHRGGHLFWAAGDNISTQPNADLLDIYAAVDQSLDLIWQAVDRLRGTIIVFSLHGMARDISRAGVVPFVMDCVNRLHHTETSRSDIAPSQRSLMRFLRRVVPARLQNGLGQLAPVKIRDAVVTKACAAGHDWLLTPGIALLADLSGYIRLNIKGREVAGTLLPQSTEEHLYRTTIETCFRELVDATSNEKLVSEVTPRSALFSGKHVELLPDLFVSWTSIERSNRARSKRLGVLPAEPPTGRTGNHTADGFAVIVPSPQDSDKIPTLQDITDLAAFIRTKLTRSEVQS